MITGIISSENRRNIAIGFIALLAALALFAVTAQDVNATDETQGQCGKAVYWDYDSSTTTLTISGRGEMYDYGSGSTHGDAPWKSLKTPITKVVVGDGVISIGNEAFSGFVPLQEVVLPDSLERIGDQAFMECGIKNDPDDENEPERTLTINLPVNLNTIGKEAFYSSGLKRAIIPKGVKVLDRTFPRTPIEYVDLGEVEVIGDYAFEYCDNLKSITLPKTLKSIGEMAFDGVGITELVLPEGFVSLGKPYPDPKPDMAAIVGCKNLTRVVLPSTLTFISDHEFGGCVNLKEIDYRGTEAQWKQLTAGIDPTSPLGELFSSIKIVYDTPTVLANPMTVKGKTVKVKRKKLKKKAQTISADRAYTVNNAQGAVTYQKVSVGSKKINKKYGKKIVINKNTGKITVKKGLKKGTYKVKVNVSAAGNAGYYPLTKTTTVKIKVK